MEAHCTVKDRYTCDRASLWSVRRSIRRQGSSGAADPFVQENKFCFPGAWLTATALTCVRGSFSTGRLLPCGPRLRAPGDTC
jgi:hypothetical protein